MTITYQKTADESELAKYNSENWINHANKVVIFNNTIFNN